MLTRSHALISLVLLLAVAAAAGGGAWWVLNAKVDPATASRGQVFRQLVWADLSLEPPALQLAWVDRLQVELTKEQVTQAAAPPVSLSATYQAQLEENIDLLQRVWFRTRAAQYAKLPANEREAFLLEQLNVVSAWAAAAALFDSAPVAPDDALRAMIQKIGTWTGEAEGAEHEAMLAALNDATLCWLANSDMDVLPPPCRRELAERFALELERGATLENADLVTDPARRAKLRENAVQLVEDYVHALALRFAAVPKPERAPFIDDRLAAIERLKVGEFMRAADSSSTDANAALLAQSQLWIDHAPEEDRDEVRALVSAVAQRLLWRKLRRP